jgi:lipopolysaccharide export system protein LptC
MGERFASWFAIALTAFVLATSWWYAQNLRHEGRAAGVPTGEVDSDAQSIVLTGFDEEGRARYRLFAAAMTHYGASDDLDLVRPRVVSLRPDQPRVEAMAETAHATNNAEIIDLRGNVVLVRDAGAGRPGLRLETENLRAIPDADRYSTADEVRVQHGAVRVVARGMEFDNVARHLELLSAVHARMPGGRP